jgi:hypothetical protein
LSLSSQKYGFGIRDPGSGKSLFRILDPGVKKAPDPDPQHGLSKLFAGTGKRFYKIFFLARVLPSPAIQYQDKKVKINDAKPGSWWG